MSHRRPLVLFAMAELLLVLAIPFVLIEGYHTLLDSRTGTFVEPPTRSEPGWLALVDPTTVVGVVEVDRGVVSGVALVIHNPQVASTGGVILIPGSLELDGVVLADRAPVDAATAVSEAIGLGLQRVDVLDDHGWTEFMGSTSYRLDNPDPVPGGAGEVDPVLTVGEVDVGAAVASAFVGRPAAGAVSVSVLPRRHVFWSALVADPPATGHPLAGDLAALDHRASPVVDLPVVQLEPVALLDEGGVEAMIRDLVAFPTNAAPGHRLQVRIVDRTGATDLEGLAAMVAARGVEVIQIGNAAVFDHGPTELVAPITIAADDGSVPDELAGLAAALGLAGVTFDQEPVDGHLVTLVVGPDLDPARWS